MHNTLEMQANQIESVLACHRVSGRVLGGVVFPQFVQFQLSTAAGTQINQVAVLAGEIAHSLGAQEARVYQAKGSIQIEVLSQQQHTIDLVSLCRRLHPQQVPPFTAVLGLSRPGSPLLLRFSATDVQHVLIAGGPGSGKTALARTLLLSLALYNRPNAMQFVLIDPNERGFAPLKTLRHLMCPLVTDATLASDVLGKLVAEVERRIEHQRITPRIVVAVDALSDLLYRGGATVEQQLTELAQQGPAAGVHLLIGTRQATPAALGTLRSIRFPVRLVGAVRDPAEARVASGLVGSEAETLSGAGDFLLVNRKRTLRFQAAYFPPEQVADTLLDLKARHAVWQHPSFESRDSTAPAKILDFAQYQEQRQGKGQRS